MSEQTTPCVACKKRGDKIWDGDDPKCSFPSGGAFTAEGWNCATADYVRGLIGDVFGASHERVTKQWQNANWSATINIFDIELSSGHADSLWVAWYKNRGRTEAMWLLSRYDQPRLPTEADVLAIATALSPEATYA